ncbi:NADH-ubiquinone oxidoreductase subunit domain protein [Candidatus Trichorickettsia mobilis]|uniref:NADH-ubiquinone oxidoreductase subunit domain protein n=1 Tax=Candidatus Trichorickettsia mobilis TaxID=1346319 RepID=A0ABZ0UR08_9RICK|nr:NADH dehydrogenase ubiquinone Fe-S protein 4 [Candidatus Trichorickettsia mobilis]WPY00465.1 NADH-ubiquinone oxidoreductase subunit domain protein [Candidatus Trichorickettsia mobilis]
MQARIYKPAKVATQSGENQTEWVLEFIPNKEDKFIEPIMGRTTSRNMMDEVRLKFSNLEEAIHFATNKNLQFEVIPLQPRKIIKKSYASNFK